jgi:hypothetical protein
MNNKIRETLRQSKPSAALLGKGHSGAHKSVFQPLAKIKGIVVGAPT